VARISTHILDVSRGTPAAGVGVELYRVTDGSRQLVSSGVTNADGRTTEPLLSEPSLPDGVFELVFHAGPYFEALGIPLTDPPFLDRVVIRFGVADKAGSYHVPLLLSPYGYSTYRGS
jgi:5-hydroxyisourate hydrolase